MNEHKLAFLQNTFLQLAEKIDSNQRPLWGKMNTQQMLEHVAGFFQVSTNKRQFPLLIPAEHLPKLIEFLWSDKEFRENTKAPLSVVPEEPVPVLFEKHEDSINLLKQEVSVFFEYFKDQPELITQHPVFGDLNFEGWVQLHHKHVIHHLKQFGVQL